MNLRMVLLMRPVGPHVVNESNPDWIGDIGSAGNPPYRRGIHPGMYKDKIWTMRQYAGFSSPRKTNQRFRKLLDSGQTGISVAFDLPTQLGIDSDDPLSIGEVGKVGVAIDSIQDMRLLFDSIDLGKISTSMTINAPATTLLALYVAVSDEKGIDRGDLSGTVQNDILKEYISRGLYIYPPEHSIRLTTDLMSWSKDCTPKWNTISVSGYHMREAGCSASQEIALTLSNALYYTRKAIESGMSIDDFAPRMSFFFACHNDFIEEVAKFRAARHLWYELVEREFSPNNKKSSQLRFHTQTSGVTLTAQQPINNAIRVAFQALSAVFGGTQSLHTNSYDEALGLPTENSVELALRTQQIIAEETGISRFVDPLGGSESIESLTNEMISESNILIEKIDSLGGSMECVKSGFQQKMIHESAWEHLKSVESGEERIIGVNSHVENDSPEFEGLVLDPTAEREIVSSLSSFKESRDMQSIENALSRLRNCCRDGTNVMESIISAVKVDATVGEVNKVMREEFGTWIAPSGV